MEELNSQDQYFRELSEVTILSPKEEKELLARIKKSDAQAINDLISSHRPLVVKVAKGLNFNQDAFIDIIQDGNLALIQAAQDYDPERASPGKRFKHFAAWRIRWALLAKLNSKRSIEATNFSEEAPAGQQLNTLPDDTEDILSAWAERSETRYLVECALSALSPRYRCIVKLYFGIGTSKRHTYEEIGRLEGCTRQRIEQIIRTAKSRMRSALAEEMSR